MAKAKRSALLNRLAGKRLVFSGIPYGLDNLKASARAHQGTVQDDIDGKTDYLVLMDLSAGKTIQKRMQKLNKNGASIQAIDRATFEKMVTPNKELLLELLRTGDAKNYIALCLQNSGYAKASDATFQSENLRGVDLSEFRVLHARFRGCDFTGAKLPISIENAKDCDFSTAAGQRTWFTKVTGCRFCKANLDHFSVNGDFANAIFDDASLREARFSTYYHSSAPACEGVSFARAELEKATFDRCALVSPDFSGANLTKCRASFCSFQDACFRDAILRGAFLTDCKFVHADLTNVDLTGANLARADLSGAILKGADLASANLRGAILNGVDFSKAKNYDPAAYPKGAIGPALKELDALLPKVKQIKFSFVLRSDVLDSNYQISVDSSAYEYGTKLQPWVQVLGLTISSARLNSYSKSLLELADNAAHLRVCYDTLEVSSSKSPVSGKELRPLVMRAISEAFAQELPDEKELAAAKKVQLAKKRDEQATTRLLRTEAKLKAEKAKEKEKKQIAKKIEKAVGKVTDIASFTKALEVRIEKPKIQKATQMLKASGFKLFNDVTEESVSGVVKSQTDPDLVYACRVDQDGKYSCCTQNLNVCGGLRGSLCKHQLVLIIGLVQAGELDPSTIDGWIAKTHNTKAELDKESMGEIFIKYKGAEAGEIDWRPTETVPEDYYAL